MRACPCPTQGGPLAVEITLVGCLAGDSGRQQCRSTNHIWLKHAQLSNCAGDARSVPLGTTLVHLMVAWPAHKPQPCTRPAPHQVAEQPFTA